MAAGKLESLARAVPARPCSPRRHALWRCLGYVVAAAAATAIGAEEFDELPEFNDPLPGLSLPVLEILHPPNSALLANTELSIEFVVRDGMLHGGLRDPRVCVSMQATFVPEDVQGPDHSWVNELTETCFDQRLNFTSFNVNGLVAGVSYGVTVGLENQGKLAAISTRSFSVAAVRLTGVPFVLSAPEALDEGVRSQRDGDPETAIRIYGYVLELFPEYAEAHHLMGIALVQQNRPEDALEHLFQAVRGNDSDDNFHNSLGSALSTVGRLDEAIRHFRRALVLNPLCLQARVNLGDAVQQQGNWIEALKLYQEVVTRVSNADENTIAYELAKYAKDSSSRLCALRRQIDGWYPADRCLKHAISMWPDEPLFRHERGYLLLSAGQFEAALLEFQAAVDLGYSMAQVSVADTLEALGETNASIVAYEQTLSNEIADKFHPRTRVMVMKATVLPRILPSSQADIDIFRLRFEAEIDNLLANVHRLEETELDPIRIAFSTAVPMNAHNCNNRVLKTKLGQLYHTLLHERSIVSELYVSSYAMSPQPYVQAERERQHNGIEIGPHRLRIGFVSRFMFNAAVGLYMDELLPQLDYRKYDIIVFAIGQSKSMKSKEEMPQIAETIVALPKDLKIVREQVMAWNVDVLVYPELGMDKTTYFLSFSRLAPIQAAWWGNADTTGIPTIDYFLASEYEDSGLKTHYSEEVYQFKGMGIYHRFSELPQQNASRKQIRGAIQERFGINDEQFRLYLCIESILHIHPNFDRAIQLLFLRDEHAHLFLLSTSSRKRWKEQLAARMSLTIPDDRVHFFTDVDTKQELLLLTTADAVVSSLHMTRPRAAFQAFSVSVPVVALPGELWASRITYGLYKQMGIEELLAVSIEDYVEIAHKLATNATFHEAMKMKIQNRLHRLSESRQAVEEWEKFFDFAGSRILADDEH